MVSLHTGMSNVATVFKTIIVYLLSELYELVMVLKGYSPKKNDYPIHLKKTTHFRM